SNVDADTAERFAADLERLGAVVSVIDDRGAPMARPHPAVVAPSAAKAAPRLQSGLAAAFELRASEPDLGALGDASGGWSLASIGGADSGSAEVRAPAPGAFAPPPAADALPASIGPAIAGAGRADEPIDMFAPGADGAVDLAFDLAEVRARRASV